MDRETLDHIGRAAERILAAMQLTSRSLLMWPLTLGRSGRGRRCAAAGALRIYGRHGLLRPAPNIRQYGVFKGPVPGDALDTTPGTIAVTDLR